MVSAAPAKLDRSRIRDLTARETKRLNERTPKSGEWFARAQRTMVNGVPSSYQERDPWPIYLAEGRGSRVWDVDGNEYVDMHNAFGSMVQGHSHPAIVEAVRDRVARGTHMAAPGEDVIYVSEELARRFGLPHWRYVNSGSEATMDAIRIARGFTGRDTIVKIFGSYHGHHDGVMVSIGVPYDDIGDRDNLASLPYGAGIPQAVVELTIPVPFNDAGAMERRIDRLTEEGRKPACVIMEAAMMNLGVVLPDPEGLCNGVFVEDVVQACLRAAVLPGLGRERFVISGPEPFAWSALLEGYAKALGRGEIHRVPVAGIVARLGPKPDETTDHSPPAAARVSAMLRRLIGHRRFEALAGKVKGRLKRGARMEPDHHLLEEFTGRGTCRIDHARARLGYAPGYDLAAGLAATEAHLRRMAR